MKRTMIYAHTKEDKSRRKAIPKDDFGQTTIDYTGDRPGGSVLATALRQGSMVYKLVLRKVKDNNMLIAIVGFITGAWFSGYFAHANMRFESLLSLVVGFIFLLVVGMWSTDENR